MVLAMRYMAKLMNLASLDSLVEGKAGRAGIGINKPVTNMAMADARNAVSSWLDGRGLVTNDAAKQINPEHGNKISSYIGDIAVSNLVSSTLGE